MTNTEALEEKLRAVVWADDPEDQIVINLVLFIFFAVASAATLGATIVFAVVFFMLGTLGLVRLAYQNIENASVVSGAWKFGIVVVVSMIIYVAGTVAGILGVVTLAVIFAGMLLHEPARDTAEGIWKRGDDSA